MKKKIILILIALVAVFTITGCNKSENGSSSTKKDNKNVYTCTKKGVKETSSVTNDTYTKDITYEAILDKDKKLSHYTMDYIYKYESKDRCNYYCNLKKEWNDEINAKNYSGMKKTTKCDCDKKTVEEKSDYDVTKLNKSFYVDITKLNDDRTFELNEWLEKFKKADYKCK